MTTWVYVAVALVVVAVVVFHKRLLALFAKGGRSESAGGWVPHHSLPDVDKGKLPVYSPERERRHAKLLANLREAGWGNNISKNESFEDALARVNRINPGPVRDLRTAPKQGVKG